MNGDAINTEKQENLLDQLQIVLEKQVEMVKNGDFRGVETFAEQAHSIVAEITKNQLPQQPEWKKRCGYLIQLYKKLELMIEVEKDATNQQLQKAGKVKKTIRAYRQKI